MKKGKNNNFVNKINIFLEWLIYMLVYALILWTSSQVFKSIYIENFLVGFISAVIIYILNKTLKPFLVTLSIPIIGMTLGLFYFVINFIILLITDLIMGKYVYLTGFLSPFVVSILISVVNLIVENLIIKPILERCEE
ncbi:MAG: phage holin family protein [Tenericutes bacterium]|nr:phage holin family protein [Mycoplasmatota bacterium]